MIGESQRHRPRASSPASSRACSCPVSQDIGFVMTVVLGLGGAARRLLHLHGAPRHRRRPTSSTSAALPPRAAADRALAGTIGSLLGRASRRALAALHMRRELAARHRGASRVVPAYSTFESAALSLALAGRRAARAQPPRPLLAAAAAFGAVTRARSPSSALRPLSTPPRARTSSPRSSARTARCARSAWSRIWTARAAACIFHSRLEPPGRTSPAPCWAGRRRVQAGEPVLRRSRPGRPWSAATLRIVSAGLAIARSSASCAAPTCPERTTTPRAPPIAAAARRRMRRGAARDRPASSLLMTGCEESGPAAAPRLPARRTTPRGWLFLNIDGVGRPGHAALPRAARAAPSSAGRRIPRWSRSPRRRAAGAPSSASSPPTIPPASPTTPRRPRARRTRHLDQRPGRDDPELSLADRHGREHRRRRARPHSRDRPRDDRRDRPR